MLNSKTFYLVLFIVIFATATGVLGYMNVDLNKINQEIEAENAELLQGVEDYNKLKASYDSLTTEYWKQQIALDQAIIGAQEQSEVVKDLIERQQELTSTVVVNDSTIDEYLRHLRERSTN